eukprot:TRINITY_DN7439_c0_g1_i1.p1 TRINITY_DN7439_c0_g1~~TRINITY_DN7439_c0_g1_i1.p1  ORF type:complete len:200 (+),score=31.81 TRINITY_DN7439_c0_g1_i1:41-640(+)
MKRTIIGIGIGIGIGILSTLGIYYYKQYQRKNRNGHQNVQGQIPLTHNQQMISDMNYAHQLQQQMNEYDLDMMRNELQEAMDNEINLQDASPQEIIEIYYRFTVLMNQQHREEEYERLLLLDENNVSRGANESQIKNLKIIEYKGQSKELETSCTICMDDFVSRDKVVVLPCSHNFHRDCVVKWFHSSKLCPICRYELK